MHGRRRAGMGEAFWQFRPFTPGESSKSHRLASVGARRPDLCARAGMGSRPDHIAVDGPFAVDGLRVRPGVAAETRPRAGAGSRGGRSPGPGWRARRPPGTHPSPGVAQHRRPLRPSPDVPGHGRARRTFRIRRRCRPGRGRSWSATFSPTQEAVASCIAALGSRGARGHLLVVADPIEESFPFTGHVEFAAVDGPGKLRLGAGRSAARDLSWPSSQRTATGSPRPAVARDGPLRSIAPTDRPRKPCCAWRRCWPTAAPKPPGGSEPCWACR